MFRTPAPVGIQLERTRQRGDAPVRRSGDPQESEALAGALTIEVDDRGVAALIRELDSLT
jgi:hypothetical protein